MLLFAHLLLVLFTRSYETAAMLSPSCHCQKFITKTFIASCSSFSSAKGVIRYMVSSASHCTFVPPRCSKFLLRVSILIGAKYWKVRYNTRISCCCGGRTFGVLMLLRRILNRTASHRQQIRCNWDCEKSLGGSVNYYAAFFAAPPRSVVVLLRPFRPFQRRGIPCGRFRYILSNAGNYFASVGLTRVRCASQ